MKHKTINLKAISVKLFLSFKILAIFSEILVKNNSYGKSSTQNSNKYNSKNFLQYINTTIICIVT